MVLSILTKETFQPQQVELNTSNYITHYHDIIDDVMPENEINS